MSEWYMQFVSTDQKFITLMKEVVKVNLIAFVRVSQEDFPLKSEVTRFASIKNLEIKEERPVISKDISLGWYVSSFRREKNRRITLRIIGPDEGLTKEQLKLIALTDKVLKPTKVTIDWEDPPPFYEGPWSLKIFREKIRPRMEWRKARKNED